MIENLTSSHIIIQIIKGSSIINYLGSYRTTLSVSKYVIQLFICFHRKKFDLTNVWFKKKCNTHFEKNQKNMTTIKIWAFRKAQFSIILKYFKK